MRTPHTRSLPIRTLTSELHRREVSISISVHLKHFDEQKLGPECSSLGWMSESTPQLLLLIVAALSAFGCLSFLLLGWHAHRVPLSRQPSRSRLHNLRVVTSATPSNHTIHQRQRRPSKINAKKLLLEPNTKDAILLDDFAQPVADLTAHHHDATSEACELLFGMPTVARGSGSVSYLNVTLQALLCQLPPMTFSPRVCIGVYEPRPPSSTGGGPTPFEMAEQSLATYPDDVRRRVFFVRASSAGASTAASTISAATSDSAASKLQKTKRQTADVASMLLALVPLSRAHLVLMEDDWLMCEGGMQALTYLLAKAAIYQPEWAALRFSYGLNGILMKIEDVPPLARFLQDPASEPQNDLPDAPVDHLTYRWLRGKYAGGRLYFGKRRIVAFRHALFWHVGDASAVGNTRARHKPKCYGINKEW